MKLRMLPVTLVLATLVMLCETSSAQNFSTDARRIGLGGTGDSQNIASRLVEEQQDYRSIPIPLGIFQLLQHREVFDPDDPNFNPARAVEYAGSPLHLTLRRDSNSPGYILVKNLVDAELNRDLNTYRGFTPPDEVNAQGLIAPSWGKTFVVSGDKSAGKFHGIYVGAGPYVSVGTNLLFDQSLLNLLASSTPVYRPNTTFQINDTSTGQGAVAITGGYRARLSPSGFGQGDRDGIYLATNFNYLHGVHYDTGDLQVRFDTDSGGLITLAPTTTPLTVVRNTSKSGKGFAIDAATAIIKGPWNLNFGVDGIGNRINWEELSARQYVLQSLFNGGDFITTSIPAPSGTRRVTLPVRYSGSGSYDAERWSAAAEAGRGMQGFRFNTGGEYRVGPLALRGGTRYSRHLWHGASGIGFNLTKGFGVDVAAFQTSTNIENEKRISFAVSLRLNRTK